MKDKDGESDSLDFTEAPREKPRVRDPEPPPKPAAPPKAKPKSTGRRMRGKSRDPATPVVIYTEPPKSRTAPLMIVIGMVLIVAYFMSRQSETPRPAPATQPSQHAAPAQKASPSAAPAQQAKAPPPRVDSPTAPAQPAVQPVLLPPEFLQVFKDYQGRPEHKAMALAMDAKGRFAHGVAARASTQAEANQEALAECARFTGQGGLQAPCRLYAVGDQVVW